MISKINKLFNYCETEKFRKILRWIVVGSLFIYFITSISAYAQWFSGSTHYFVYNSTSGLVIRIFTSILFIGSCLLVFVSYKRSMNIKWLCVFLFLLVFILICMVYTPTSYYVLYRTTKLYDFMAMYESTISLKTLVTMYFSFAVDVIFAYCFIFILPKIFAEHSLLLFILIPFLLIMFYSMIYSLLKETTYYVRFIKGDWEYSADTIGSIFGNKQQWGIFLAPVLPVSIVSYFIVKKTKFKTVIKMFFYIFCAISFFLAAFCSLAIFCKTAIISNMLFLIFGYIGLILWFFINKKKKIIPIILITLIIIVIISLILIMNISSLHQSGIGKTIFNIFDSLIKIGEIGAESRLEILIVTLQNFPMTNIFFGFSKGVLDSFVRTTVPYMNNGLHTGMGIYFGRTGIIGLTIYVILFGLVIWSMIKIMKKDWLYGFVILGTLVSSFILNLGELEILIVSSSATVYILNLVAVTLPISETLDREESLL